MNPYRCLQCGSSHGEPATGNSENWYWRITEYGRVGPFDNEACSGRFKFPADAQDAFTLEEHTKLVALQQRYQEGL